MADKKNFREMGDKELAQLVVEYKEKLREMRFEKVIGSNFNISEYKKTKRDIARIKTILREKEIELAKKEQ